jgi:hypothetical protein
MDKPTKKSNSYNSDVIKALVKKYGYTERYIRMCLSGDREGIMADNVKKDYKSLKTQIKKTIENNLEA